MEKPALCLVNKMDTEGAEEKLEELKELLGKGYDEGVTLMDEDSRPRRRNPIQLCFWIFGYSTTGCPKVTVISNHP